MYAKIINEETKQVIVGTGTNTKFYKSIGMTDMEVEKAYNGSWYVKGYAPKQPLEEVKEAKLTELRTARDAEENKPVTTDKGEFDFDELSQRRINNAIALTSEEETRKWTLTNGEIVEVTKADLLEVVKTGAMRSDNDHNKWLALEELVNEATTVEEVEAIKWNDLEPNDEVGEEVEETAGVPYAEPN